MTSIGLDQRLITAATSGDAAAFSALVERHRAELQVHAYRMLGSLEDAQDAVQDALLRAWRSRETYDGRSTFRAWLYRITTNACLRILERRPRRLVPYEEGPAADLGARPVPPADLPWLQPYPDRLIDESPEPDDAAVRPHSNRSPQLNLNSSCPVDFRGGGEGFAARHDDHGRISGDL